MRRASSAARPETSATTSKRVRSCSSSSATPGNSVAASGVGAMALSVPSMSQNRPRGRAASAAASFSRAAASRVCTTSKSDIAASPWPSCPAGVEEQAQRVGDRGLHGADNRPLHAAHEGRAAGDERVGRADGEVRDQADACRHEDGGEARQEEERNDRDEATEAVRDGGRDSRKHGCREVALREAKLLMGQRAQELLRLLRESLRQRARLLLGEALEHVHQRQLFLLLLGILLDLLALAVELGLVDLALALGRQIGAGAHRERAGEHAGQSGNEHGLAAAGGAGHAADDAEDGAQAVVGAVNGVADPAAATLVPALTPQHEVQHALRALGGDHLADDAPMRLLFAADLAQHALRLLIADGLRVRLVACDVHVLRRLHLAQRGVGADPAANEVAQAVAPGDVVGRRRGAELDELALPLEGMTLLGLSQPQQHGTLVRVLLAGGQVAIGASAFLLASPVLLERGDELGPRVAGWRRVLRGGFRLAFAHVGHDVVFLLARWAALSRTGWRWVGTARATQLSPATARPATRRGLAARRQPHCMTVYDSIYTCAVPWRHACEGAAVRRRLAAPARGQSAG